MLKRRLWTLAWIGGLIVSLGSSAWAGTITLTWDPADGAQGYRVYYGAQSQNYTSTRDVGNTLTATIDGIADCQYWHFAVKAYNTAGESAQYSNEVAAYADPRLNSTLNVPGGPPGTVSAKQGDAFTLSIPGANFISGAQLDFTLQTSRAADVAFQAARVVSCTQAEVDVAVRPNGPGDQPAAIGTFSLVVNVANPDQGKTQSTYPFDVVIDPARFDVNKDDAITSWRLDGKDTVTLSKVFGTRDNDPNFDPDTDFTGDGQVDGDDLHYLASNLGYCWSGTMWNLTSCPAGLR
jgi:hypothetical protein